jgi:hypothetical protein
VLSQERGKIADYQFARENQSEQKGLAQQAKADQREVLKTFAEWHRLRAQYRSRPERDCVRRTSRSTQTRSDA